MTYKLYNLSFSSYQYINNKRLENKYDIKAIFYILVFHIYIKLYI